MSCNNIQALLLSDTFNTWFERTNETIGALNAFRIRGLSANDSSTYNGLLLADQGSCLFNLNLVTGPFIGFETSLTGVYGEGTLDNPNTLTLKFSGGESAFSDCFGDDQITGDDYVPVSDTSQSGLFKKAPVSSFVKNFNSGSNISIEFDCASNTYTISYVELLFTPNFNINGISTSSSQVYEITEDDGTLINGPIRFDFTNGGNVNYNYGVVNLNFDDRVLNFDEPLTFTGTDGFTSDIFVQIPYNSSSWFDINQVISFTTTFTPNDRSVGGVVYQGGDVNVTKTIYFGWRFGGCVSTQNFTTAQQFVDANLINNLSELEYNSIFPWSVVEPNSNIFRDPSQTRFFNITINEQDSYLYFAHSDAESNGGYGWEPTLLQDNGSIVNNGLVSIGYFSHNGGKYQLWKSGNRYDNSINFGIK